jgi:hypothetical protein
MKIIGTSRRERRNVVTLGREMLWSSHDSWSSILLFMESPDANKSEWFPFLSDEWIPSLSQVQ